MRLPAQTPAHKDPGEKELGADQVMCNGENLAAETEADPQR